MVEDRPEQGVKSQYVQQQQQQQNCDWFIILKQVNDIKLFATYCNIDIIISFVD